MKTSADIERITVSNPFLNTPLPTSINYYLDASLIFSLIKAVHRTVYVYSSLEMLQIQFKSKYFNSQLCKHEQISQTVNFEENLKLNLNSPEQIFDIPLRHNLLFIYESIKKTSTEHSHINLKIAMKTLKLILSIKINTRRPQKYD